MYYALYYAYVLAALAQRSSPSESVAFPVNVVCIVTPHIHDWPLDLPPPCGPCLSLLASLHSLWCLRNLVDNVRCHRAMAAPAALHCITYKLHAHVCTDMDADSAVHPQLSIITFSSHSCGDGYQTGMSSYKVRAIPAFVDRELHPPYIMHELQKLSRQLSATLDVYHVSIIVVFMLTMRLLWQHSKVSTSRIGSLAGRD